MPAISASAPGKIILFGEHAVVYGQPAVAAPVHQVSVKVIVSAEPRREVGYIHLQAPEVHLDGLYHELPANHPLVVALRGVLQILKVAVSPACRIRINSSIPVAAGMGSGAAVSVAIIRAYATFLGHALSNEQVSELAYEVEKLHHGSPSGIDNTVITYERPVYFVSGQAIQTFRVPQPFLIVIADTGVPSPTASVVGEVRRNWQANPDHYETLFSAAGQIAAQGRALIEGGEWQKLGPLLDENQAVLAEMGVSSPELDKLVRTARQVGALGAKLSGGGRGGNMIALVEPESVDEVRLALLAAGARRTIITEIKEGRSR